MQKVLLGLGVLLLSVAFVGQVAYAAPLAEPEPLFEYGDVQIFEFGMHYVKGFGEVTIEPSPDQPQLTSRTSIQGSTNMTFTPGSWITHTTRIRRDNPNNRMQLSHNANTTLRFHLSATLGGRPTTTTAGFAVAQGVTVNRDVRSFNSEMWLHGFVSRENGSGAPTARVSWWVHP